MTFVEIGKTEPIKRFTCKHCGMWLTEQTTIKREGITIAWFEPTGKYICDECGRVYKDV